MKGLKITAGIHPMSAKFFVGDQELMVMGADIRMRPDEVITATIEMAVENIDIELLTSGVTIEPIDGYDLKPARTAYVIIDDLAPPEAVKHAIRERSKYLDKKFPNERFAVRVVKRSEIGE